MSEHDGATVAALARIAVACDGAILGLALAFCAAHSWAKYFFSSSALDKIRDAPAVRISDLRSLLSSSSNSDHGESSSDRKLVVIRGEVQGKWALGSNSQSSLVAQGSGERAVIIQRTQTCLYNELRGIFGWSFDLRALFAKTWKEQRTSSLRSVPFILVEGGQWPNSGFVHIKLDGSFHPLPLTTVYHQLHPIQASSFTFFQAVFGHGYPIALLDEEKILPIGKDITAVGICRLQDGVLEIKSCDELPCFLSDMTKDELEADLAISSNVLLWSGVLLGALSAGVLGYAIVRNWWRWKDRRNRRRQIRESTESNAAESTGDEESGDVPDGELCVVCLTRRRRSAFIPCGHLVCCSRCALAVERDSSPKCPVCRQNIRSSVRIYDT